MWFFLTSFGKVGVSLEFQWGSGGTSRDAKRKSSLFLNFEGELRISLKSLRGIGPSAHVDGGSRGLS